MRLCSSILRPRPQLFDFVHIPERSGGWKVQFGKDHPWNGMTVIDLIFEESDRWLLAEPLAYDLHRRAGLAACRTDFLRLNVDGQPAGYYLLIEQPNKAFLRRNGLRDDGNMYKANWVGNGLTGQHDKRIIAIPATMIWLSSWTSSRRPGRNLRSSGP
jgi:hypothetical protein